MWVPDGAKRAHEKSNYGGGIMTGMVKAIIIIGCCIIAAGYILALDACLRMRHEDGLLD